MPPRAFVMGWPIAHSRSPLIHTYWLEKYGIEGSYVAEAVTPADAPAFFAAIAGTYVGGNVTIPHKEAACRACDHLAPAAERLGAVNTLWVESGRLCGDNTDAFGFAANLDEKAPAWRAGKRALVLGAGGAARAVLFALLEAGYGRIDLLNRTEARASDLAYYFGDGIYPGGLGSADDALAGADLVVNTTSAGLAGSSADGISLDWRAARPGAIATDIVYVPLETPFLREAKAAGLATVDGLGMLLHQAVPGFERWFGRRPEVDRTLRSRIERDIRAASH